jgi:hypothetical protein
MLWRRIWRENLKAEIGKLRKMLSKWFKWFECFEW